MTVQKLHQEAPPLNVDALLDDTQTRIVVCCGSGGVGKTTTAAALALRAAERGRTAVVITVDPARRLAQSLGLDELDNTPRQIDLGPRDSGRGTLHAMMLDMKRTFDEVVRAHADPERAEQILANPFYQSLSTSFSGTQEYMAMEKLGQLRASEEWDLIVVDTPPSRSALDFLDAPNRLGRFLDGRLIRMLGGTGGRSYLRMLGSGFGLITTVINRVIGAQLLSDVRTFVSAFDAVFGGFQDRARHTYELLKAPGTEFLVVAAPESDALREASYFVERLAAEGMPLAGLVLNKTHGHGAAPTPARLSAARSDAAAETLEDLGEHTLAAAALRLHARRMDTQAAEARERSSFVAAHPTTPVVEVPAQPDAVADLTGLRRVGHDLGSGSGAEST
ncbi:ArsA-related P-loop ATPase [Lipingzhangella sp. LS1_29]|uniref:ArsA-related P-loop ATPase n=1 Tax=Lipingzhangella rawalii TaxID=2055835 RepID=A0ABU2H3Y5_9ACTN|nr:ArsA-related P-loop ATPase [Lipingzhangella rawalii]MDS1270003.1 ArsA-related P-loop ATPase [Lipingzhangella rawalii]